MFTDNLVGKQSICDKKVEVCAVYSSFHIAQLQLGLSQPLRLGQAKTVKVNIYIYLLKLKVFFLCIIIFSDHFKRIECYAS